MARKFLIIEEDDCPCENGRSWENCGTCEGTGRIRQETDLAEALKQLLQPSNVREDGRKVNVHNVFSKHIFFRE